MHLWPFSLYCSRKAGKKSMGKDIQQMDQGRFDPRPLQLPNTIWVICLVQTCCEIQGLKRKFKKRGEKKKRIQLQIWHKDHFWRKYHIVCHCQPPLIFFIWISFQKMSLSICHCKSEWEYFATGTKFATRKSALWVFTQHSASQSRWQYLGSRRHQINWFLDRVQSSWLWKQLDIWRLRLHLCYVKLA